MRVGSPNWGSERGPCAANVEVPAIPRLVGRSSVSLPATTPNSAHSRPTRGPDANLRRITDEGGRGRGRQRDHQPPLDAHPPWQWTMGGTDGGGQGPTMPTDGRFPQPGAGRRPRRDLKEDTSH